jgi:hypothetical protein
MQLSLQLASCSVTLPFLVVNQAAVDKVPSKHLHLDNFHYGIGNIPAAAKEPGNLLWGPRMHTWLQSGNLSFVVTWCLVNFM